MKRALAALACVVLLLLLPAVRAAADDVLQWDAAALFDESQVTGLRLANDGGGKSIELDDGWLVEDDGPAAGYSYKPNTEKLDPQVRIKKQLIVERPAASAATLLVGPGGTLEATVNGRPCPLSLQGKVGGYWQAYGFDPGVLKPGVNEIVLGGEGKVWIARDDEYAAGSLTQTTHPNRSAKSTDGGRTWDDVHLGAGGDVDGEYYVRLHLDLKRPRGKLTLPVVDLGNLARRPVAPPLQDIGQVAVAVQTHLGQAGRCRVRWRSGRTPALQKLPWSDWTSAGRDPIEPRDLSGRFFQLELELATDDALASPGLDGIAIHGQPIRGADWTKRVRVTEADNPAIVRSSIPFQYEPLDHPRLKQFRQQFKLDEVVAGAAGEFELITRLAAWSAMRWKGLGHLAAVYPAWDALAILKKHEDGTPVGGFCQQYNLVFLQACESFGLCGRAVSIGPGSLADKINGRGGHEVVEIWSNEYAKWVYVDGNAGWYAVDAKTEVPLSLWELRERQLGALVGPSGPAVKVRTIVPTRYQWKGLASWPPFVELRMIPRSNFLAQAAPLPLNQGMRGWFWTGHYAWTDDRAPADPLYSHRVRRRGDWQWTLNRTHVYLLAQREPGAIRIELESQTPSLAGYWAAIDDGPAGEVAASFDWKLHTGENRLHVTARNTAARDGPPSRLVLDYQP